MNSTPDQNRESVAFDQRFRSVAVLQYNEIQLLEAGRYNALAQALQQRLNKTNLFVAVVVLCLTAFAGFGPVVLAIDAALMVSALSWTGPRLYRLRQLKQFLRNRKDPEAFSGPADRIDDEFRHLTTLMFNEIQLLKKRQYLALIAAVRTRLIVVVSFAVAISGKRVLKFHEEPENGLFGLSVITAVLIWALPRFFRLYQLKSQIRELGKEEANKVLEMSDTLPVPEAICVEARTGTVRDSQDPNLEVLQQRILAAFTLSYSDIQRIRAGCICPVLRKLRNRTCIYCGIGSCLSAVMAWAFRDEPIGLSIAVALIAIMVARCMARLRMIADLNRAVEQCDSVKTSADRVCG
jgi:hypothetical protein